jgi:hypothetical protein
VAITILIMVAVLGVVFLVGLRMVLHAPCQTVEVDAGGDVRTGGWFKVKLRKPLPASTSSTGRTKGLALRACKGGQSGRGKVRLRTE